MSTCICEHASVCMFACMLTHVARIFLEAGTFLLWFSLEHIPDGLPALLHMGLGGNVCTLS